MTSILLDLTQYNLEQWSDFLDDEKKQPYFIKLLNLVSYEYSNNNLFPLKQDLFKALELTNPKNISVIFLGQDPYHNDLQADGLAFSCKNNLKTPKSLLNIFKEINLEFSYKRKNNDLSDWANQNVLLINTILTVVKHQPLSCKNWGWEKFVFNLIKYILDNNKNVVIICLGRYSQNFVSPLVNMFSNKHIFINSAHPSPLSAHRNFFGSNIFKKANDYLKQNNKVEIKW